VTVQKQAAPLCDQRPLLFAVQQVRAIRLGQHQHVVTLPLVLPRPAAIQTPRYTPPRYVSLGDIFHVQLIHMQYKSSFSIPFWGVSP